MSNPSNINIGRQGSTGIAFEATPGVGVSPTDYVQYTANTLQGTVKNENISNATQNRNKVFSSVATEKMGKGDIEMYLDAKISPYFIVAAFGQEAAVQTYTNVYDHTITVLNANSNSPTLTIIDDHNNEIDFEAYYSSVVDTLDIAVTDSIATLKAGIQSQFPQTTASGNATTASGTVYAFPSAKFAFGATVGAADSAANIAVHDFSLSIKNNIKAIFRQGSINNNLNPSSFNAGDFESEASFKLYFENVTDRNSYYNSSKQAAVLSFFGGPLQGGYQEWTKFRWYQTRIDTFALETGLSNFYIEDVKLQPEWDNVNNIAMDCLVRNSKPLYI
jgi:hypothetical protein